MKKVFIFLISILLFACDKEDIDQSVDNNLNSKSRIIPSGDPNLNSNWNWESSQWNVNFRSISGSIGNANTVNPFYNDPIFGNADPSKIDMRASDGWMLVARDFGTTNDAPRHPWIMLYNRFRGLLRVCVLRTSDLLTSDQNLSLSFDNSVVSPGLFKFVEETEQLANTKTGSLQWMVGEFNLQGFDSNINRQARFRINISEVASQTITLDGNLSIVGIAQPQPSKKSLIGSTYEVSSYASKLWNKLPDFGKDPFKSVVKAVGKNPFDVTNAAAGLIKSLTGSGKTPAYNIRLDGTISLDGNMSLSSRRGTIEVYLRNDANSSGQPKALKNIPWGIMNYSKKVKLKISPYGVDVGPGPIDVFQTFAIFSDPNFFDNILTINPSIQNDISIIEAGWVIHTKADVQFNSLELFKQNGYLQNNISTRYFPGFPRQYFIIPGVPKDIAIRITFKNGDVIFNRIPIDYEIFNPYPSF